MSCENIEQNSYSQRQQKYITGANAGASHGNLLSVTGGKTNAQSNSKGNHKVLKVSPGRQVVQCVCTHALPPEDHHTAFGRYVTAEMRNIGNTQVQRDAKRLIMNILFEAQSKAEKQIGKNSQNSTSMNQNVNENGETDNPGDLLDF